MKQYVIIAKDDNDEQALARRMQVRPMHLAGAAQLKARGNFVIGGATLDETGSMNGSVIIVQFETEAAFKDWYASEPYIVQGVWKNIEVKPFRVASVQ